MKRRLRARLSLVTPNRAQAAESKQEKQRLYKDTKCNNEREFVESDKVRVRSMGSRCARLAQLVRSLTANQMVLGSIPSLVEG